MRNAVNVEVMLAPPRVFETVGREDPNAAPRPAASAYSVPAQPLEPHHETLGVECQVPLQDLVDFRIAERAAVAAHQLEPQFAHRGADAGGRVRILRVSARDAGQLAHLRLEQLPQARHAGYAAEVH